MEENVRYFWVESVVMQIFAIVLYIFTMASVQDGEALFRDVKVFTPVTATCTKSKSYQYYDSRDERKKTKYDNYYMYEVDGKYYQFSRCGETSNENGRLMTIYYNPNNPNIHSYYQTLGAYKAASIWGYIGAIALQLFALLGFGVSIYRKKSQKIVGNCKGQVIQDDFDFVMPKETLNEEEAERGVQTIAFVRNKDFRPEDVQEELPWENRGPKKKEQEFVLYTEDEYKKIKK